MNEQAKNLLDLDYLVELSGGDPGYQRQVLTIFLENIRPGLANLEALIGAGKDWEAVHRQAHALKSGLGVVRIQGMLEDLQQIDAQSLQEDRSAIPELMARLLRTFREAEPELVQQIAALGAG